MGAMPFAVGGVASVSAFAGVVALQLISAAYADPDHPILHEYVPALDDDDAQDLVLGADAEPEAIVYEGEMIPAPAGGRLRDDERAMVALPDDGGPGRDQPGRRSPTFRPDRITSLEEALEYFAVFSPSIAPFKRVTALDAVVRDAGGVPVLGVAYPNRVAPVPVVNATAPSEDGLPRDRFWGSVVLDFSGGARVPLPSVAPDSRILTLRTEPEVELRIEKDAADNFFAITSSRARAVRLTFLTDAPREYFNARRIPDVPVNALADEVFPLDDATRAEALSFARRLGVGPSDDLPTALARLTEHFRSFVESDEPPPDTGNIFRDLAEAKQGVCRHRAYAFVITAHALGLPARFVMNEAHAWVEVKLIGLGWMRIDLGGAANGLSARGGQDRPVYRPHASDPLPQPWVYRQSYSQLSGPQVDGLREGEGEAFAEATREGTALSDEGTASGGEEEELGDEGAYTSRETGGRGEETAQSSTSEGPRNGRPLLLTVDTQHYEVFRGRPLTVSGRALDPDGRGVSGLRIEVAIRSVREQLLGVTVTGRDGGYRASVGIPPDLAVGEYRLDVRSPGNAQFFPARAHR